MIGARTLVASTLMAVLASQSRAYEALPAASGSESRVFLCQHFRTMHDAERGTVRADLTIVQSGSLHDATGQWTAQWPGQSPIAATPFPASFGSVGGSVGLRLQDANGRPREAYISFSDIHAETGKVYFWLNLDRPSLWQPPGYGCESQATEPPGASE